MPGSYYNLPPGCQHTVDLSDFEKLLRQLPLDVGIEALDLLETITRNIVQYPTEEKYRKLRTTNEKLQVLFGAAGHKEIMLDMGWQVDGEFMVLPKEVKLTFPKHIVKFLEAKNHYSKQRNIKKGSAKMSRDPGQADTLQKLELDRKEAQAREEAQTRAARAPEAAVAAPEVLPTKASAETVQEPRDPSPESTASTACTLPSAAEAPEPKQTPKTSPDFAPPQRQTKTEPQKEMSLQELRALQKSKFQDFKENPTAAQTEAFNRPPSDANTQEPGWFDWLWGGSSSSSGGGGAPPPSGQRPKPKMKGVADLPKPVQRGG